MEVRAVVVTLVTTVLLTAVNAEPREQFVFRLLTVYQGGQDQAAAADRDNNDVITDNEFLQSLFFFTDNKRDRQVTQAEFVDGYRRQFGLPSELLVIMFDLLDDLNDDKSQRQTTDVTRDNRNNEFFDMFSKLSPKNGLFGDNHQQHGDGILTPHDVTVHKFVGGDNQRSSKEEYRKSLMKWVAAAADRLYSINYQPHIPGNPWDREFDYERWFISVDRNNDSLVSFGELRDEFRRYSPDGRVQRREWVERNLNQYGDREWLANVVFDYWDKNKDLQLDDVDIARILREADRNRDMQVTTIEFHRFMEKYNKRARRRLATPIRPVMYDCPSPWWQSIGCRPRVDATRAAMDMDDNFDGWITRGELRKRVSYYDRNGDGWASRTEVMMMESMRYGVQGPTASVMFDIYDRNADGRYDLADLQYMLSDGRVLCFCDARRAILDLVKLAEKFRDSPQAQGPVGSLRNAMRWHMARERQWRRQAEQLWQRIWGQGGGGGNGGLGPNCREGDCTGKDWRGETWYSPFDWRQRNRVPENFLQWTYLQNIPRTLSFPGMGAASGGGDRGFFFPPAEGAVNPWGPRGKDGRFRGGNRGLGGPGNAGNEDNDLGGGSGFVFPGSSRPRPGGFRPLPKDFMPNPSKVTSSRTLQTFPMTKFRTAQSQGWPRVRNAGDRSSESGGKLWDRVLAARTDDADSNRQEPVYDEEDEFFSLTQPGSVQNDVMINRNWPKWNWMSGAPPAGSTSTPFFPNNLQGPAEQGKMTTEMADETGLPNGRKVGRDNNQNNSKQSQSTRSSVRRRRNAAGNGHYLKTTSSSGTPPSPPTPSPAAQPEVDANTKNSTTDTTKTDGTSKTADQDVDTADEAQDQMARSTASGGNPLLYRYWLRGANRNRAGCDHTDSWTEQSSYPTTYGVGWGGWELPAGYSQPWQQTGHWPGPGDGLPGSMIPQWWNRKIYYDNNWHGSSKNGYRNYNPSRLFYFSKKDQQDQSDKQHLISKRSSDEKQTDRVSRMMDGYSGYWPQQWNWGNKYNWPGYWNNWSGYWNNKNDHWNGNNNLNRMWNSLNRPFHFTKDGQQGQPDKEHLISKRSSDEKQTDLVSRMMGGDGGYWPHWWNRRDSYNNWPGYWNDWNRNWNGLFNKWTGYWDLKNNNYNNMWNNLNRPFHFTKADGRQGQPDKEHLISKRSSDTKQMDHISRMMGDYDGYRPQWWNSGNNYNNWPGYWNNWPGYWNNMYQNNDNWMRNNYRGNHPFSFSRDRKSPDNQDIRVKRSADGKADDRDDVSRMMGGYGGYWPQWRNWGNNYNNWPGYWNNRNGYWSNWNVKWNDHYNGVWNKPKYPFYFAQGGKHDQSEKEHLISKRSLHEKEKDQVSRMMGGHGGYWPQWRNWRDSYNNRNIWNGFWNNWNRYWNNMDRNNYGVYPPFSFSQGGQNQNTRTKRSADEKTGDGDEVSKMMGRRGSYWPTRWNNWNGNWNSMQWGHVYRNYYNWNRHTFNGNQPFSFLQEGKTPTSQNIREKRSADEQTDDGNKVTRITSAYGSYWPQRWNWGSNIWNNWNGYGNTWNSYWRSGNNFNRIWNDLKRPLFFTQDDQQEQKFKEHLISKRSSDIKQTDQVSRMMGGYGDYWPQWWNSGNNYNWPGYRNNWPGGYKNNWNGHWNDMNWDNVYRNNYNWISHTRSGYHPFAFSHEGKTSTDQNTRTKRSPDKKTDERDEVSRMMGGYNGYWPQWWNWGNNYNNRPGYSNNWNGYNNDWRGYWKDMNWDNVYRNNYNWISHTRSGYHPVAYSQEAQMFTDQNTRAKRSADKTTGVGDDISRMMSGYGGYWPQWRNWGNNYNKWPGYWNNWNKHWNWNSNFNGMGNNMNRPFHFTKDGQQDQSDKEHLISKRSSDEKQRDQVSRMMNGYGGYRPQWQNWGNNYNNWHDYWNNWPGYWNNWNKHWNWNSNFNSMGNNMNRPFHFTKDGQQDQSDKVHLISKRSSDEKETDQVSRMMGSYGGYWPQWWDWRNDYNNWPGYSYNRPNYRNNWDSKRYWHWNNNYNKMWNNLNRPFYFAKDGQQDQSDKQHLISKRSSAEKQKDQVSRMAGSYGGHWPQLWNWENNYNNWPGYWSNWNDYWNWNAKWNRNGRTSSGGHYPFSFAQGGMNNNIRAKRSADKKTDDGDDISRMMGGYGGYWPQWWNWGNNYNNWPGYRTNWPGYRNNWNAEWNSMHLNNWRTNNGGYYPLSFKQEGHNDNIRAKRSADKKTDERDEVSRMMGGYAGYWPQWWNWGNTYNNWSGYRNNWNGYWNDVNLDKVYRNNYNWISHTRSGYHPFAFSHVGKTSTDQNTRAKRSADKTTGNGDDVSRMMNGYGGYWPQWRNWENPYNNWPGYWNNWNAKWNRNWRTSNGGHYPFSFAQGGMNGNIREKRSADKKTDDGDDVSRMMGGYWPQRWNWGNNYNNWPGYRNNWNAEWNSMHWNSWRTNNGGYYPFSFSQRGHNDNIRTKRSADKKTDERDEVSRMMGGYSGYWPQWWNWGNNYNWPGYWNNWNGYWNDMNWDNIYRNNYNWISRTRSGYHPFAFSQEAQMSTDQNTRAKRSADKTTEDGDDVSRMMSGYGGYWPQWWNWGNNYNKWPGYWNNWPGYKNNWPGYWNNWNEHWNGNNNFNSMGNNMNRPFHFTKDGQQDQSDKQHLISKRSSAEKQKDQVSRMAGSYGGHWPQWWNWENNYNNWPGYWSNWNGYWNNWNAKWNRNGRTSKDGHYPFSFAQGGMNGNIRAKRSADKKTDDGDDVSRMMGGYGGYWPQWWNWGNNYNNWPGYRTNWPGYRNNWNEHWNWNSNFNGMGNNMNRPFHFTEDGQQDQSDKEHLISKRSSDVKQTDQVSRMMDSYGGYWPQWRNRGNNYNNWHGYWNNWPGYWNNWNEHWNWNSNFNSMGNNMNRPFHFTEDGQQDQSDKEHLISKRSSDVKQTDQVSRMMDSYGGYWPQWWNWGNDYNYRPGYWNNWNRNWNSMYNWMRSSYRRNHPFSFSREGKTSTNQNTRAKRNAAKKTSDEDDVSKMTSAYGDHSPQWWNSFAWPGVWNNWNGNLKGLNWEDLYWNYCNWIRQPNGGYHPVGFAQEGKMSTNQNIRSKRSADKKTDEGDEASKMTDGYSGYWPQWWNRGNDYNNWPDYWNNWPGYRNNWNSNWNSWSGSWNTKYWNSMHWRNNWRNDYGNYYPFSFSQEGQNDNTRAKRSADKKTDDGDNVSRMMGGYGGYWPDWWNWGNNRNYQSGYWNNWNSNWYTKYWNNMHWNDNWRNYYGGYYPFSFPQEGHNDNTRAKRSADKKTDDGDTVSRMMGGYGGYWPDWLNWGSYNNYQPGYWNNWNGYWNNWEGNMYYRNNYNWVRNSNGGYRPYSFSKEGPGEKIRAKRSADVKTAGADTVSRMAGGYDGYWPQWWNRENNYNWPGYWNNWNGHLNKWTGYWLWNNNYNNMWNNLDRPFHFSSQPFGFSQEAKPGSHATETESVEPHREKRNVQSEEDKNADDLATNSDSDNSGDEPDVAKQLGGWPGNMLQQPRWTMHRLINSRPWLWSRARYSNVFGYPYGLYWNRHQYRGYRVPVIVYRIWDWRKWENRIRNRGWYTNDNDAWDAGALLTPFFLSRHVSASSSSPPIRQQTENAEAAKETEKAEEMREPNTNTEGGHRSKRSLGNGNHGNAYPYNAGSMYDHGWPNGRRRGMSSYVYWPWSRHTWYSPKGWNGYDWYGNYKNNGDYSWYKDYISNDKYSQIRPGYDDYPFMFSQDGDAAADRAAYTTEERASRENKDGTDRAKRSAGQQNEERETAVPGISKWMSFPEHGYNQPVWRRNGLWMTNGRWFMNRKFMSVNGMHAKDWNWGHYRRGPWNTHGNVYPFSSSTDDASAHERKPQRLHKRSTEAEIAQEKPDEESDPKVSRWMSGFRPEPFMSVYLGMRPYSALPPASIAPGPYLVRQLWPGAPTQGWQFKESNFQQQHTWNSWGGSRYKNHRNSGFGSSFPFSFSAGQSSDATDSKLRQKRSSTDHKKDEENDVNTDEKLFVSSMGRDFGDTDNYFSGVWNRLAPRFANGERWMRLSWPGFGMYRQRPWWAFFDGWNPNQHYPLQYPKRYDSMWHQYQYTPMWNRFHNGPAWGWGNSDMNQNSNRWNRANPFSGDYVEESFNDPLSSFHFSRTDSSSNADVDEVVERRTSQDAETEVPTQKDGEGNSRRKRSVSYLVVESARGQVPVASRKANRKTRVRLSKRIVKREVPRKVKRFSSEAEARLQKRFQKRSASSEADSTLQKVSPASEATDAALNNPIPASEIAPKLSMRATAPARGQNTRDREWALPRGSGFPQNPNSNTGSPNSNPNPNWNTVPGSDSGSGQGMNPYGGSDRWNWDQSGLNGNQNWFEKQGPGQVGSGQRAGPTGHDNKGTADGRAGSYNDINNDNNGDSPGGGSTNRLDNYNYVDVNNPDLWNQVDINATIGSPDNSNRWGNWFGMLAYGPQFWADVEDLDLWGTAWGQGPWEAGYVLVPSQMGWGSPLREACPDSGFPPTLRRDWWNPDWSADVIGRHRPFPDVAFTDRFRPYSPIYLSLYETFRPTRSLPRPMSSFFRPRPYAYDRFRPYYLIFRPTPSPFDPAFVDPWLAEIYWGRGQPAMGVNRWWLRHSGPWIENGNSGNEWDPWQFRIQYGSNVDHEVRRHRRSAPGLVDSELDLVDSSAVSPTGRETASYKPHDATARETTPSSNTTPSRDAWRKVGGADESRSGRRPQWWSLPWWDRNNWHGARSSASPWTSSAYFPSSGGEDWVGSAGYGRFPAGVDSNVVPADHAFFGLRPAGSVERRASNVPFGWDGSAPIFRHGDDISKGGFDQSGGTNPDSGSHLFLPLLPSPFSGRAGFARGSFPRRAGIPSSNNYSPTPGGGADHGRPLRQ